MSEARALWTDDPVAANVRAEMARRNISTNRLQFLVGGNQAYWQRRTSGNVPLSANDIVEVDFGQPVDEADHDAPAQVYAFPCGGAW